MDWTSDNLKEAWTRFNNHAKLMFQGPLSGKTEKVQCAFLLIWLGDKGRDIFSTFTITADEQDKIQPYMDKFSEYFLPQCNTVFQRYLFHKRDQRDGEPVDQYITDLNLLARECAYSTTAMRDEMVRDRLVCGISSAKVREKLLQAGSNLTLSQAITIVRTHVETQVQLRTMSQPDTCGSQAYQETCIKHEVDFVRRAKKSNHAPSVRQCYFCGGDYSPSHKCPAKGKICSNCEKPNHFAKVCKSSKKVVNVINQRHQTNEHQPDSNDELFIDTINMNKGDDQPYVKLIINEHISITFKIDTGAQANIIPETFFNTLKPRPKVNKTLQILTNFGGQKIPTLGVCSLNCAYTNGCTETQPFFIVKDAPVPILGFETSKKLKLIKLILTVTKPNPFIEEFKDVFQGIGQLEGECHITLKEGTEPKAVPARRIPISLQNRFKKELDRMEALGVIKKVTYPTDWVNAAVVVEKPDKSLRVCIDPQDLNKAIKRPHHPMPTFDEAILKHSGAKFFTKLDARHGYWSLILDNESSHLTTFNTPYGRYMFKRMPFGLISAQDEFQRRMEEAFEGIKGFSVIVDDIIISGETIEEHDANVRSALIRARERTVKFNLKKCVFGCDSIPYFGHIISKGGIHPDPRKVRALKEMRPPSTKDELQTILGMMNYLARYIPNLASLNQPLRNLAKQQQLKWEPQHNIALNNIKESICSSLTFFDPKAGNIKLQVDASKFGLGATLIQNGKSISFASRSLNTTEQNYSQIEKELYAILFGCIHYHQYLYGQKFIIISDHKPLQVILNRPISKSSPRLQRMLLRIQPYDFTITFHPGKEIPVADALSRMHLPEEDGEMQKEIESYVHSVMSIQPISNDRLKKLKQETTADTQLVELAKTIKSGWPASRRNLPAILTPFWNVRHDLTVIDQIILKGDRLVIPKNSRKDILNCIHASHLGIEKTKQRARSVIFWPRMTKDIEEYIKHCYACTRLQNSNQKEPLRPHDIPDLPWEKIGCDLFYKNGEYFLITVDYYSRFFEVDRLGSSTYAHQIIPYLKKHFARYGIPRMLITDNGPQFTSSVFQKFISDWEISHTTSSPHFPQSNGLAERSVQTAKDILSKTDIAGNDFELALLEYRNTPVDGLASPSQLLMSRNLRSIVPCTKELLAPKTINHKQFRQNRMKQQSRQSKYYDRQSKQLKPLQIGQPVQAQIHGKLWQAGIVKRADVNPRSYIVETNDGATYRRNRRHIKIVCQQPQSPDATTTEEIPHTDTPTTPLSLSETMPTPVPRTPDENRLKPFTRVHSPTFNRPIPVPSTSHVTHTELHDTPYITRTGRAVNPVQRLNL